MNRKRTFFQLVNLAYANGNLTVRVAELVEGTPDGYIGTPLVVGASSQQFAVHFEQVSEFRSKAEPCFVVEGKHRDVTGFLFECVDSNYIGQVCPFGVGAKEPARHFGVFTESVVIEVLSSHEPRIEVESNAAQQCLPADAPKAARR